MRCITLIENTAPAGSPFDREHGLSLLLESRGKKILFDTGKTGTFAENARRLGVDLKAVDMVVLSHGHYDHCGGLERFFHYNNSACVYIRRSAKQPLYRRVMGNKKFIGVPPHLFSRYPDRFIFVDKDVQPAEGIHLLASGPYNNRAGLQNAFLFMQTPKGLQPDIFAHEHFLVLEEGDALFVFTGCSHKGVTDMLDTVTKKFPGKPIQLLAGGFHLMDIPLTSMLDTYAKSLLAKLPCTFSSRISASFSTLLATSGHVSQTAVALADAQIPHVYTGHCTGRQAFASLKTRLGETLHPLQTGTVISL